MSRIHSVQDLGRNDVYAVSGVTGGPKHPLGTELVLDASNTDETLYYVTSTGVLIPNSYGAYDPAATDVAVQHLKGRGQTWIYVYNDSGATIERGNPVANKSGESNCHVRQCVTTDDPAQIVGVAQHDIATAYCGWVVKKGVCEVLADATGTTVNAAIMVSDGTAGCVEVATDDTVPAFGWAQETLVSQLATCFVNCPG